MQPQRTRIQRRAVHGVLLLDKPLGLSSNDALQRAKRLYRAEKAGHTGTLDPLATGLLPLCFGAATKFSQISLDADKRYLATLKLGVTTTTADAEGDVIETRDVSVTRAQVQAACERFTGPIEQVPPMHSALKRDGKALYEYARAGIDVEREARAVTIHAIEIMGGEHDTWTLDVRCSKGTYIRSLARDIARALGTVGHVVMLRRAKAGPFTLADAVSLDKLAEHAKARTLEHILLPLRAGLDDIPALHLTPDQAGALRQGRVLAGIAADDGQHFALLDDVPVALVEVQARHARVVRGFNL